MENTKLAAAKSQVEARSRMDVAKSKADLNSLDIKSLTLGLDPVRPGVREMVLRAELLKKTEELAKERIQKQEAISKIEAKYDGYTEFSKKQAQEYVVTLQNLKTCYKENKVEIEQLRSIIVQQNAQIADYKAKYIKALQQVEEMKKQMDNMDMDNNRMSDQINLEILNIKNTFRQKLRDLEPLPDKLKRAEAIIQQMKEEKAEAEHRADILTKQLNIARERIHVLLHTVVEVPDKRAVDMYYEMTIAFLEQKISTSNSSTRKMKLEIERLKSNLLRAENEVLQNEIRLTDKINECTAIGGELDHTRLEATEAVERMAERFDTTRRFLETNIKDLESRLENANAQISTSQQEKQNLEQAMTARFNQLNECYEVAQHRILALQTQLRDLRQKLSISDDEADGAGDGTDEPTREQRRRIREICDPFQFLFLEMGHYLVEKLQEDLQPASKDGIPVHIKSLKHHQKTRAISQTSPKGYPADLTKSSPQINCANKDLAVNILKSPREGASASDTILTSRQHEEFIVEKGVEVREQGVVVSGGDMQRLSPEWSHRSRPEVRGEGRVQPQPRKSSKPYLVRHRSSPTNVVDEPDDQLIRQIRDIHNDTRKSARIIKDSRARLLDIQKKPALTEADVKELGERNELLLREMERFDRLMKKIQKLVGTEAVLSKEKRSRDNRNDYFDYVPGSHYESTVQHEMKMAHPTVLLAGRHPPNLNNSLGRSKSEIDLTRKLNESYDMQEKLVADNADLEVKRYILYKELMTKDQYLETSRAQVKRLQGELKLMTKENASLRQKLGNKNNPQGDAPLVKNTSISDQKKECAKEKPAESTSAQELVVELESYNTSTKELEKQLNFLEVEARTIREEMDAIKLAATKMPGNACRGSGGGPNKCFEQAPGMPPEKPMNKACGVCPPCPAPCNPNAPPTPAEREVGRLTLQLRQTEENFKTKVTECALLRAELMKKKEELEKERCMHRDVSNKLRELEMKFEGLTTHTNMMLGTKEQALENEVNVRALKQCYREAREEIEELRLLLKEQNEQLQDYRVKYMQAQQLVEEQKRQMDMMDLDNTRISEQINHEIQRVKLKFQEKLQELAPIPDLLKATQVRLKDAQQSQALAEHNAEQLARELNCAREKVHVLLHNVVKPPPDKAADKAADEKAIALLQQRISQLTELNSALKMEIERLKSNVIRMEETVLANEKRLQEKMHECAQLGGELDRTREEATRALQRAEERLESSKKCLQTTIAELERQLATARAQVRTAQKEREELQCRMQCQIKRLNDNFEQAQLRILGLTTQVQTLRRTVSSTDGLGDTEQQQCTCKTLFNDP